MERVDKLRMGVNATEHLMLIVEAAEAWKRCSRNGPFEGLPVPETAEKLDALVLENMGWFVDRGDAGTRDVLKLNNANFGYSTFKQITTFNAQSPDRFERSGK
jgi:hypothetical protein